MNKNENTEVITDEIQDKMQKETGLYLLELPTGSSKSYSTFVACDKYLLRGTPGDKAGENPAVKNKRPILFLTPQKKNLKFDKICQIYQSLSAEEPEAAKKRFEEESLQLRKKYSYLKKWLCGEKSADFIASLPEKITDAGIFIKLCSLLQEAEAPEGQSSLKDEQIENELDACEMQFRLFLRKDACQRLLDQNETVLLQDANQDDFHAHDYMLENIERLDKICPWIRPLYPGTFAHTKRLICMSFHKFIYGNTSIIPGMRNFMEIFSENPIIIIDEVDSTHEIYEDYLIKEAISHRGDIVRLFERVRQGLRTIPNRSYRLRNVIKSDYKPFLEQAERIYKKYHLDRDLKYEEMQKAALFGVTTSLHFTIGKYYSYMEPDEDQHNMRIHLVDSQAYKAFKERHAASGEPCLYPAAMLMDIQLFFNRLYANAWKWAEVYAHNRNAEDKEKYQQARAAADEEALRKLPHPDAYSIKNAILTIYDGLGISQELRQEDREALIPSFDAKPVHLAKNSWEQIMQSFRPYDYFRSGYSLIELINRDSFRERTLLRYFAKQGTGEGKLEELAKQTMVIGISATAAVANLANYHIPFLRDNLKDSFYPMSEKLTKQLASFYQSMQQAYDQHHIKIKTQTLLQGMEACSLSTQMDVYKYFTHLYRDEEHAEEVSHMVCSKALEGCVDADSGDSNANYIWKRYCSIAEAMAQFYRSPSSHAWLFLNYCLLKENNPKFDFDVIRGMQMAFDREYPKRRVELHVLSSSEDKKNGFEQKMQEIRDDLAKGIDVLVFSSYASVGTGIDIDYESNHYQQDYSDYFEEDPNKEQDARHGRRDFDGFVLGEITHLLTPVDEYYQSKDEFTRHKMLSNFLTLHTIDQLKYQECRDAVRCILDPEQNNGKLTLMKLSRKLKKQPYVAGRVKYLLMQALGRGNRAFVKNHTIHIFCHENNLAYLLRAEPDISSDIRTPEWQALCQMAEDMAPMLPKKKAELSIQFINTCHRADDVIRHLLSYTFHPNMVWTKDKRDDYELLGDFVLRFPTFDSVEEILNCPAYAHCQKEQKEALANFASVYLYADEKLNNYKYILDMRDNPCPYPETMTKKEAMKLYQRQLDEETTPAEHIVSDVRANLQFLFRQLPELRTYMADKGYATSFKKAHYILPPVLFINFYLGRLGELVGSWILEHFANLKLRELDNEDYELFDRLLPSGEPIDFKHWRILTGARYMDRDDLYNKVEGKIQQMRERKENQGIEHAYIIRLCQTEEDDALFNLSQGEPYKEDITGKIISIPYLVNHDGVNFAAIKKILANESQHGQNEEDEEDDND